MGQESIVESRAVVNGADDQSRVQKNAEEWTKEWQKNGKRTEWQKNDRCRRVIGFWYIGRDISICGYLRGYLPVYLSRDTIHWYH